MMQQYDNFEIILYLFKRRARKLGNGLQKTTALDGTSSLVMWIYIRSRLYILWQQCERHHMFVSL